jgi:nitroreductase
LEVFILLQGKYADSIIYKRHSVRNYTNEPLKTDQLEHILHAGMAGPSAHNAQPWFFVVIDDQKILEAIAKGHPYGKMMDKAQLAILVCAKKDVVEKDPFFQQDLGASIQNMLLAATESGVGSCWCGVYNHVIHDLCKLFIDLLNIPDDLLPFAVIALGVPSADQKKPSDRFEESRIHRNAW